MVFKRTIKNIVRCFGYDIVRFNSFSSPDARQIRLLKHFNIDLVLDIGANIGQYGMRLRSYGYRGRIISFEPLNSAYDALLKFSKSDSSWDVYNFGLGNRNERNTINVARNSYSSSLLKILPSHLAADPDSVYIREEEIELKALDSIYPTLGISNKTVLLKIDAQGFENNILDGAKDSLIFIDTIQLEMSLTPLYVNEVLFSEMHQRLKNMGYQMVSIEPGFLDKESGRLLQVDGIYHNFRKFSSSAPSVSAPFQNEVS